MQELLSVSGYISGLTLQSYLVPSMDGETSGNDKQVRLYMTMSSRGAFQTGEAKMIRVNLNAIDEHNEATTAVAISLCEALEPFFLSWSPTVVQLLIEACLI